MANSYVLLISNNSKGFTANALFEAINKSGIETRNMTITDENLLESIDYAFSVFIVDINEHTTLLSPIKNKCQELNKKVILFGTNDELSNLKQVFSDDLINKEFVRPCEMDIIVAEVKKLFVNQSKKDVRKKLLVVDDNGVMLRTILGWLEGRYDVALANSATSALMAIQKEIPDLILLDYEMPVCSGAQLMEMLSLEENTKDIPIIFLTSKCDADTVKEVMKLKPKGYILKSTPQEQLIKKIDDFFRN